MFAVRRTLPADVCEHCCGAVDRVWLVPGDVLNSCQECYRCATGQLPVHEQGHSTPGTLPVATARATFHLRADGRRPA